VANYDAASMTKNQEDDYYRRCAIVCALISAMEDADMRVSSWRVEHLVHLLVNCCDAPLDYSFCIIEGDPSSKQLDRDLSSWCGEKILDIHCDKHGAWYTTDGERFHLLDDEYGDIMEQYRGAAEFVIDWAEDADGDEMREIACACAIANRYEDRDTIDRAAVLFDWYNSTFILADDIGMAEAMDITGRYDVLEKKWEAE